MFDTLLTGLQENLRVLTSPLASIWHRADRVRSQDQAMTSFDRLLTVQDLADYLDVPVATIYAWRYRRHGPRGFRVGKHLRFRQSNIERWIEDRISLTCHNRTAQ